MRPFMHKPHLLTLINEVSLTNSKPYVTDLLYLSGTYNLELVAAKSYTKA